MNVDPLFISCQESALYEEVVFDNEGEDLVEPEWLSVASEAFVPDENDVPEGPFPEDEILPPRIRMN